MTFVHSSYEKKSSSASIMNSHYKYQYCPLLSKYVQIRVISIVAVATALLALLVSPKLMALFNIPAPVALLVSQTIYKLQ